VLQGLGCQASQGFYFARPMPATQLGELLERDSCIPVGTV
jgi:EAL domain-containing protein (putative c-di-GMP-specific phosphodiesterase class I)